MPTVSYWGGLYYYGFTFKPESLFHKLYSTLASSFAFSRAMSICGQIWSSPMIS